MHWIHCLSYLFGGFFVANAVPHLGMGITGHAFQSPFATPSGVGLSTSTINVVWGLSNLIIGYLLVYRVGHFELRRNSHIISLGAGIALCSLLCAYAFGRFHGGL